MVDQVAQLVFNGLFSGTLLAVVAIGFALAHAVAGHFHVAHHALWIVATFVLYLLSQLTSTLIGLTIAMLIVALASAGAAIATDRFVYRPLQKRGGVDIFVASLALLTVIQSVLALAFGTKPLFPDFSAALGTSALRIGPLFIEPFQAFFLAVAIPLLLGIALWMRRSRSGRLMLAVVRNAPLATVLGIDVPRIVTLAYAIGALGLAPAALVLASQSGAAPYGGLQDFILAIAAAFAARPGRLGAVILMSYVLGLIREMSLIWVSGSWQTTIALLAFIALVYITQRGPVARTV